MAKKAAKQKFDLPVDDAPVPLTCRACGQERALDDFRFYRTMPDKLHMDFCVHCELEHGTLVLYRRYNAYGTEEIIKAVFEASRVPEIRRTPDQVRLLVEPSQREAPRSNEQVIQLELARREMAKRRFLYFASAFQPNYKPGWVHQDIARRLERFVKAIEDGKSPRLMICMPPRHGKSVLASDLFPSWVLGKHPEWPIIATSYAQSLPLEFSRNIRDRMEDPEYKAVFPETKLRPDAKGIEAWKTTKHGGYVAAGVGTGITGKGFMLGIVDDPIKDQEAAQSETIRDATIGWYQAVFRTRAAPGAGILVINTRWHWHDVSGRLLEQDEQLEKAGVPVEEREGWEVVSYPAIAENDEYLLADGTIVQGVMDEEQGDVLRLLRRKGEALHPERYPLNELKKIKNTSAPSIWTALYQQKPTPDEGDYFKKDDFRYRWLDPTYRELCRRFITVDYAIGKKQRNDFTVIIAFALDSNDDLYVLGIDRGRWGTRQIAEHVLAMVKKYKPELYAGEQGQIHHAVWPIIQEALDKEREYVSVDETLVPIQDKEVRARPIQGRAQRHKLFFSFDDQVKPEIYDIAEREMLQFPDGVNDDIVDALAWGGRLALNISLPTMKAPPSQKKSWKDKLPGQKPSANPMAA